MTVDYLHFAMPLTKYHKQQLKKNGLRDLTNRMQNRWNGDTANRSLETDNKVRYSLWNDQFVVAAHGFILLCIVFAKHFGFRHSHY